MAVPEGLFVSPVAPEGTFTVGGVVSCTVTVAFALLPPLSVQAIVEVPIGRCAVALNAMPVPAGVHVTSRFRWDLTW
jgi:hypothetical protein